MSRASRRRSKRKEDVWRQVQERHDPAGATVRPACSIFLYIWKHEWRVKRDLDEGRNRSLAGHRVRFGFETAETCTSAGRRPACGPPMTCACSKLRRTEKGWRFLRHRRTVAGMIMILSTVVSLLGFRLRRRASLELVRGALRHQVSVLRRQRPGRLRLFSADRLLCCIRVASARDVELCLDLGQCGAVVPVLAQNSEGPRKAGDFCATALPSRA
jgi:hypothetical protein